MWMKNFLFAIQGWAWVEREFAELFTLKEDAETAEIYARRANSLAEIVADEGEVIEW